jgi:hypothetical protein
MCFSNYLDFLHSLLKTALLGFSSVSKPNFLYTLQTTNYGLGGLCETHIDPHGALDDNVIIPEENYNLYMTGKF